MRVSRRMEASHKAPIPNTVSHHTVVDHQGHPRVGIFGSLVNSSLNPMVIRCHQARGSLDNRRLRGCFGSRLLMQVLRMDLPVIGMVTGDNLLLSPVVVKDDAVASRALRSPDPSHPVVPERHRFLGDNHNRSGLRTSGEAVHLPHRCGNKVKDLRCTLRIHRRRLGHNTGFP